MAFQIRKARRSATKLRLLLTSPSGGGKTYSSLLLAKGLGGKTIVIDTEEGSSDLYDTLHDFDVVDLKPPFTPERYIEAITACEQAGYEVIVIDSVTHCWSGKGGCLELVDDIAKAKFRGNTWSAFSEITPRWRAFVDAILRSSAHVICTGRSKTETAQVDDHGKKKVAKLGMKLEARDGLEYEFTCVLDIIHDGHYATVSKDRTGLFIGDPKPITEETGRQLANWLQGAADIEPATSPASEPRPSAPVPPGDSATKQRLKVKEDAAVVMTKASKAIAAATTAAELDRLTAGVIKRQAEGVLTADQAGVLHEQIAMRELDADTEVGHAVA